jgi:hypothetical protein
MSVPHKDAWILRWLRPRWLGRLHRARRGMRDVLRNFSTDGSKSTVGLTLTSRSDSGRSAS